MMNTTAILSHLQRNNTQGNTVCLLSNHLYQAIAQVWSELPGVKLVYEPLSNYNKEYLTLLTTLGITIKCSNQELLENLTRKQNVVIGTGNLTSSFIRNAYTRGYNNFAVSGESRDFIKLTNILGDNFRLTEQYSKEEGADTIVKEVLSGRPTREICLGVLETLTEIRALNNSIIELKRNLPADTVLNVELGQELFQSTSLIATKIIRTKNQNGQTRYDIDMSMFEEFASYLDTGHNFTVHSQHEDRTRFSSVYGNTGDEDDLILEGNIGELNVGDWLLIGNVGEADCRGLDIILLDKDYRVVTKRRPSNSFSNSLDLDTNLLTVSA